ncbi:MAG: radical SAM-associated putative lipoprotein [Bacteroidales bacterium]|nr:radical SAM-associated putative lipoprotein [Bacteroidales bacterium]
MRKAIAHILILLLATTAVLSCSVGFPMEVPAETSGIEITGAVTDGKTGEPLDEIKITLTTTERLDIQIGTVLKTAYTDNNGTFTIMAEGVKGLTSCVLIAEDPDGIYETASQVVNITWSESNMLQGIFYVNDIIFYLEKAEK